jgi:GT2 family glycosyltransferase
VSIIIPVFNQLPRLEKCLEAISSNTPLAEAWEVVAVNNGSAADVAEYLAAAERRYPRLRVLTNEQNQGFSRACNQGAAAAACPNVLFLNSDTEVQSGWLRPLVEVLCNDPRVGAVGARLLYPDNTLQHAGIIFALHQGHPHRNPLDIKMIYRKYQADLPDANELRLYPAVSGACILLRKQTFAAVGGFEEGYWNGCEDLDLCLKLLERGLLVVYEPKSCAYHHEFQSGPERFRRSNENAQLLRDRWLGKVPPGAVFGFYTPDTKKFIVQRRPQRYIAPAKVTR